ncbi:MAG TPA: ABC transporter permease, partial [Chloroflexota bacterium]|nr:ABC transporter permease [Chloroflexota bacterium]
MMALVIRRAVQAIPTLFVVSIIMFGLLMVGPNPLQQLKQNPNFTDKDITRLTKLYGWDKPLPQQYLHWAGNFVTGDMGKSIQTQRPASEMIFERLPVTLMLTGASMVLSLLIAIPIGAYVAVHKYSRADYTATLLTFGMMATPSFFLALLLQLFALKLQDWAGGTLILATGGAPSCAGAGGVFGQLFSCLGSP